MALTIEDLKPKSFIININGVEVTCKPPRLSHTLAIAKVGEIFKDTKNAKKSDVKQAEVDMDEVVGELMPDLKGVELGMSELLDVIAQIMQQVKPSDNKFLDDKGVTFDTDPKAEKIG